MRIGLNALFLIPGEVGGTETYIRLLAVALARSARVESLTVFANRENAAAFRDDLAPWLNSGGPTDDEPRPDDDSLHGKARVWPCGMSGRNRYARVVYEQLALPWAIRRSGVDLIHSAGYVAPLIAGAHSVVTIPDLNFLVHPDDFGFAGRWTQRLLVPLSARLSHGVFTLTESARAEIVREFGLDDSKVLCTPCGIDPAFESSLRDADIERIRARYGLPERYAFCPSASHPHKNLERLLRAYALLSRERRIDFGLVVTGSRGRADRAVRQTAAQLDLENQVRLLGWIDRGDMPALYAHARCLIFPTLYEGFGLPLIEAFASGTPAAVSDIPPLREVAGGAARFFNPFSVEDIAAALEDVSGNETLRARLAALGSERAGHYTMERAIQAALDAYERLLLR